MFRFTITLMTIFILSHQPHFATARRLEQSEVKKNKIETKEIVKEEVSEAEKSLEPHSRSKRAVSWGTAISVLAGASAATNLAVTIHTEIDKCKSYEPDDCRELTCEYIDCPNVCTTPDVNDAHISKEKEIIKDLLTDMERTQLNAFNLATKAIVASTGNDIILAEIEDINNKVDRLLDGLERLDRSLAEKFANKSLEIAALIRDYSWSVDDITGTGTVQGIFDKWTWEGTGAFVLSVALPIGYYGRQYYKKRAAIRKMATELKTDFLNRARANAVGSGTNQAMTRDFWVQHLQKKEVAAKLYSNAKIQYHSQQLSTKPNKWSSGITGAVNLAVSALSIYTTWYLINKCEKLADDMQDRAYNISKQHDEIQGIKETQLDPLWDDVNNEAWPTAKAVLTNETTLAWLEDIRNLTLNAEAVNETTAATIQYFIDNIDAADVDTTISLQQSLIEALKSIEYEYDCLGDKMHAINIVLEDCQDGRDSFEVLYNDVAVKKNELNREDCVSEDMVPYTSIDEFRKIVEAFAEHNGWYSNCLLNNDDLWEDVCAASIQGYSNSEILREFNRTDLTLDVVANFLTRCEDLPIKTKAAESACNLYCLYLPVSSISQTAILTVSQVESVIKTCPICDVEDKVVSEICYEYYCKLEDIAAIEAEVRIPNATLEYVLANNCSKCIIYDTDDLEKICDESMCKVQTPAEIAADFNYPEYAITDVVAQCDVILPSGCPEISQEEIDKIEKMYCEWGASAEDIANIIDLPLETVQSVTENLDCS